MNLIDKITSYVDNELKNQNLIDEVKDMIINDEKVRKEYFIQSNIKNLLKERFTNQKAPDYLKKRIINNIHFISTPVKKEKTKNIKQFSFVIFKNAVCKFRSVKFRYNSTICFPTRASRN